VKILVLDPRLAGISGDMLLGALVDLTGEVDCLYRVVSIIEEGVEYCEGVELKVYDVERRGIRAKRIELVVKESVRGVTPEAFKRNLDRVLESLGLSEDAKGLARRIVDEICEAEARVHGAMHELFEVASVDTIFDVVGAIALLEKSGLLDSEVYTTPPALGYGVIKTTHGLLSVPTPMTLEILRRHGFAYSNLAVEHELTTPTGAALLVNLAKGVIDYYPSMMVKGVGYGAGSRDLELVPNVLRAVLGEVSRSVATESVVVLETTVDDVTGEVLGHVVERLLELGALDVVVLTGVGKKNRPAHVVRVLSKPEMCTELAKSMIEELGTLGVRVLESSRLVVERVEKRVELEVCGKRFEVKVKESKTLDGRVLRVKPEYEDLKRISRELGVPLWRVAEIVQREIEKRGSLS
jgi:uncharacterized protein (TIGR00299 family) protein